MGSRGVLTRRNGPPTRVCSEGGPYVCKKRVLTPPTRVWSEGGVREVVVAVCRFSMEDKYISILLKKKEIKNIPGARDASASRAPDISSNVHHIFKKINLHVKYELNLILLIFKVRRSERSAVLVMTIESWHRWCWPGPMM